LGIDCSPFQGPIIPVIYNMNFRDPAGYFMATKFEMRNKDVIYISNALSPELAKFRALIGTVTGTINDPINTAINIYTLRNIARGSAATATAVITGGGI